MNPEAQNLCEQLDAALFSADTFSDPADQQGLMDYLARWNRKLSPSDQPQQNHRYQPMKKETKLALAAALIALAAELTNEETPASAAPAPTGEPATDKPAAEKPRRGRPPASEKPPEPVKAPEPKQEETQTPAAEEKKEEASAPASKTVDDLRALFAPLVKAGRIAEVKTVVSKYAESLIKMDPKDYAAFEADINAILSGDSL